MSMYKYRYSSLPYCKARRLEPWSLSSQSWYKLHKEHTSCVARNKLVTQSLTHHIKQVRRHGLAPKNTIDKPCELCVRAKFVVWRMPCDAIYKKRNKVESLSLFTCYAADWCLLHQKLLGLDLLFRSRMYIWFAILRKWTHAWVALLWTSRRWES